MFSATFLKYGKTCAWCIVVCVACVVCVLRCAAPGPRRLPARLRQYLPRAAPRLDRAVDAKALKLKLDAVNALRNITNLDKFAPMDDFTPIFIVQVHRDVQRLQYLILSLAQVRDIHTVLLIFSHSFYHEWIDRLVKRIEFCKVMQIYYPHSLQLHPHGFPGTDAADCPPGVHPALPCERNASLTEHKQHWWWKANYIFRRMDWWRTHGAPVLFLEESDYVAPDLVYMLQYAQRSLGYFPYVEVMAFGRPLSRRVDADLLILEPWRPPFDVGLSFNKTTWNKILSFSAQYCMHNDYTWTYSLFNLFENFHSGSANMVACSTPRVVSTKEYIDLAAMFEKFSNMFHPSKLFPEKVQAVYLFGRGGRVLPAGRAPPPGCGGWSDLRDQLLCLDPLFSTTTEEKRYNEAEATRV